MKKTIILFTIITSVTVVFFCSKAVINVWMMSIPETTFDNTAVPAAPDYSNRDHWSALPDKEDSADWVPYGSNYKDKQASAEVDVFFVYPTAAFYGDYWVAGLDNLLHRVSVDYGIQSQHVTAFNGIAKIYTPRYRSVRMPIWWAEDRDSVTKATAFAYADVKKAFEYYMQHWNNGRPVIIVSHSQGTLHTIRLLQEQFDGKPLGDKLIAAYLVGNTLPTTDWFQHIPVCNSAEQTGCYVTWNTILDGGDPDHWVKEKGLDEITCVNPLSWKADQAKVDKSVNQGSIPMVGFSFKNGLSIGPLQKNVVGARCGPEGILWIENKPQVGGYTAALFDGGSYHTYDINFYYDSIRNNAKLRTETYLKR